MFAIKLGLFSIGIIVVLTSVWLNKLVKLIMLACLNIVGQVNKLDEHVSKPFVLSYILVKLVLV
jgi:hypothetical protein